MPEKTEHVVARAADLPPGAHCIVTVGRREIGIFNVDGQLYALPNLCTHQLGPLCKGKVSGTLVSRLDTQWKLQWEYENEIITCPWHGLEYNITTGQCLAFEEIKLRSYEVWIDGDEVKLRL